MLKENGSAAPTSDMAEQNGAEETDKVNVYNTAPYKRSRAAYHAEALLEYLISLTIVDSFLAALAKSIGLSDALTGICASIVSIAGLTQIFTVFFDHSKPKKRLILGANLVSQLMFACLYFLPFFDLSRGFKTFLFALLLLGGYLCANITAPMRYSLAMSSVERSKFGSFTATKEMISLLGGMLFEYALGLVADYYRARGEELICYVLFGCTIVFIAILHAMSVGMFREDAPTVQKKTEKESLASRISEMFSLLKDRKLRSIILVFVLWKIADYFVTPFMGTYAIDTENGLGYSLTTVSVLSIVGCLIRFAVSKPVGKLADKTSQCVMLIPMFSLAAIAMLCGVFAAPGREWLFVGYRVLRIVSLAGISGGTFNLILQYVPEEQVDYVTALNQCVIGIAGFLSSLVASALLSAVQNNGNTVLGIHMYAQQLLSAVSAALTIAIVIYLTVYVRKIKRNV